MAKARIEEKVTVAAADMPHVAAEEGLDPGFVDERDIIGHADGFIPVIGLDACHGYFVSMIRSSIWQQGVTVSPTAHVVCRRNLGNEGGARQGFGNGNDALEASLENDGGDLGAAEGDAARVADEPQVFGPDGEGDFCAFFGAAYDGQGTEDGIHQNGVAGDACHFTGNQRAFAHEGGAEARGGLGVDPFRGAFILNAALVHDDAMIGERHGLFLVMGDMDEGGAHLFLYGLQLILHLAAELEIKRPQGLIEKQHGGLHHKGAGQRHALALAAGKLVGFLLEGFRAGRR